MRIAYGKLGRSIPLSRDSMSYVGGDIEVVNLLHRLGDQGHHVHIVSRNRNDFTAPWLTNLWHNGGVFDNCPPLPPEAVDVDSVSYRRFADHIQRAAESLPKFDAWIIWLGQNGSTLHPLPKISDPTEMTSPLVSLVAYGHPVIQSINVQGAQPIFLCPDPRNTIKFRDLWAPLTSPVLAQYNYEKRDTFYDERDGVLRESSTRYTYSAIEMLAVKMCEVELRHPPLSFGLLVNEGPSDCKNPRRRLVKEWTASAPQGWEIFGVWSDGGSNVIGRKPYPIAVDTVNAVLSRWRYTITFPASGSGWATTKPWECFASGCVCFKHPAYDDQKHVYSPDRMPTELYEFLTPKTEDELHKRGASLNSETTWKYMANMQRSYLLHANHIFDGGMKYINDRLR